ncbi:MAG: aspartate carbamoyltransferase catalytic subunit [Deltaproteobacteria bacterium]|nr:aspartate carbamoyltransferase catalytic subunit [Deltaproteobacteria bacterium]
MPERATSPRPPTSQESLDFAIGEHHAPLLGKHLLGLEGLSREQIQGVLDVARRMKDVSERPVKKVPTLRGKTVVCLFHEASTRTRSSFEIAAKRLSADTINVGGSGSSTTKGETLLDTALNLEAMRPDAIVVRHSESGACNFLARQVECPVINAGDGAHEHPSQGLLDLFTMQERLGSLEGLKVAIVGDLLHSRVVRSNLYGLRALGAEVHLCGPGTLISPWFESYGARLHRRIEPAIEGADVIMMLRIQRERQGTSTIPSLREYERFFGLSPARVGLAKPDVIIMHPGPMNRGVEISPEVADGPYSVILDQVTNGVAVRMALLYLLVARGSDAPRG